MLNLAFIENFQRLSSLNVKIFYRTKKYQQQTFEEFLWHFITLVKSELNCFLKKKQGNKFETMEQYTSANVEMAVLQFYYQGASQETHQWLTSAQMSTSAWNFAWELLMPDKKPEVQFFGASTIAIKVSKFWHEVPSEQVDKIFSTVF